jgi:hypothetical protein
MSIVAGEKAALGGIDSRLRTRCLSRITTRDSPAPAVGHGISLWRALEMWRSPGNSRPAQQPPQRDCSLLPLTWHCVTARPASLGATRPDCRQKIFDLYFEDIHARRGSAKK